RDVARLLRRDGDLRDAQSARAAATNTGEGDEQHGPDQRSLRLLEHGFGAYTVAVRDRVLRNSCSEKLRLSLASCVFFRHSWIAARVGAGQAAGNTYSVVWRYVSPGSRRVDGNSGWFGESGKRCASRHTPLCAS